MENKFRKPLAIILTLAVAMGSILPVFAAETGESESDTGSAPVKLSLSLEEAYELYKKSDDYALIQAENESDRATIKEYSEQISNAKEDKANGSGSTTNINNLKDKRSRAQETYEANVQARENAAYQSFMQEYFGMKSREEQFEIAKKTLENKKTSLELTETKYEYGSVSKIDLLNAKISYSQAESSYSHSENELMLARMEFNAYLGINLYSELTLTSKLEEVALSDVQLEAAIDSALENRSEIKSAEYSLEQAQKSFGSVSAYPSSSATYLKGKTSYLKAQINARSAYNDIEIDVTRKYTEMHEKYDTLSLSKMNLESAQESYELELSRYELGMSTLSDVQNAEITLNNAEVSYADSILNYRMAVTNYELCMGAGISISQLNF